MSAMYQKLKKLLKTGLLVFGMLGMLEIEASQNASQKSVKHQSIKASKQKSRKRILLVCTLMKSGSQYGVERAINQLRDRGYEVDIDVVITNAFAEGWSSNVKKGLYTVMNKDVNIFGYKKNPADYDAVLITFAVWVGSIDLPMKRYLELEHTKITDKQKVFFLIRCRSSDQDTIFNLVQGLEKQFNIKVSATGTMRSTEREKDTKSYLGKLDDFAKRIDLIMSDTDMFTSEIASK